MPAIHRGWRHHFGEIRTSIKIILIKDDTIASREFFSTSHLENVAECARPFQLSSKCSCSVRVINRAI